jgi:hypothetical protein
VLALACHEKEISICCQFSCGKRHYSHKKIIENRPPQHLHEIDGITPFFRSEKVDHWGDSVLSLLSEVVRLFLIGRMPETLQLCHKVKPALPQFLSSFEISLSELSDVVSGSVELSTTNPIIRKNEIFSKKGRGRRECNRLVIELSME